MSNTLNYKNLPVHSWVDIKNLSTEQLDEILESVYITRYALGGVSAANKGIKEITGDMGFWDKFVWAEFHNDKRGWRLGSCNEQGLNDKKITFEQMINLV